VAASEPLSSHPAAPSVLMRGRQKQVPPLQIFHFCQVSSQEIRRKALQWRWLRPLVPPAARPNAWNAASRQKSTWYLPWHGGSKAAGAGRWCRQQKVSKVHRKRHVAAKA